MALTRAPHRPRPTAPVPVDNVRFTQPEADLLQQLGTTANGLSAERAAEFLDEHGANTVAAGGRQSVVMDLLQRCRNPLVIQLLVIATVSYVMGDLRSTIVVGAMLFLSVFLSYIQEARSSRAVEKLQKLVKTTVTVLRDQKEVEVPLEEVVPGDIVVLAAGSLIPADLRILSAKDFFVTQSALTGESMPVEKNADAAQPAEAASSRSAAANGQSPFSPIKLRPRTVNTPSLKPFFSTTTRSSPGHIAGRFAGRHTRSSVLISASKPFWSHTWSPSVITSTPRPRRSRAIVPVMPAPAAEFSAVAMSKSSCHCSRSAANWFATISRPGRPTMSPMKRREITPAFRPAARPGASRLAGAAETDAIARDRTPSCGRRAFHRSRAARIKPTGAVARFARTSTARSRTKALAAFATQRNRRHQYSARSRKIRDTGPAAAAQRPASASGFFLANLLSVPASRRWMLER